ncbi:WYL domain-containing protein, partial [Klebsiella pneumoniae]
DVNLVEFVAGVGSGERNTAPVMRARLWLAEGRAVGIRRQARVVGRRTVADVDGDVVELDLWFPESAADWIAGHGPDALVLEPDVLAKAVADRWERVVQGVSR